MFQYGRLDITLSLHIVVPGSHSIIFQVLDLIKERQVHYFSFTLSYKPNNKSQKLNLILKLQA